MLPSREPDPGLVFRQFHGDDVDVEGYQDEVGRPLQRKEHRRGRRTHKGLRASGTFVPDAQRVLLRLLPSRAPHLRLER